MDQQHDPPITKASGKVVAFSPEKLMASLQRAGADPGTSERIVEEIRLQLVPALSTRKIHRMAFALLKQRSRPLAGRYRLKQAIMDLGPSGFPFEKFIARILEHEGYRVEVGRVVQGKCVTHEIDVIALQDHRHFMVECKYHNRPGRICDVKVPLYVQARFKDVEQQWRQLPGHGTMFHQGWVVTNTRFTSDAMQYGRCAGLYLLSWDHPNGQSLKDRIDRSGLFPITCLSSLTKAEKQRLLEAGTVLCGEICGDPDVLHRAGVRTTRISAVLKEGTELCTTLITLGRHRN